MEKEMKIKLTEKQKLRRDAHIVKKRAIKAEKKRIRDELDAKWDAWRLAVFTRDNWTCFGCGKYLKDGDKRNIQPHHCIAKETYPEFMYEVCNGITLCYYCHKNSKNSPHLNAIVFSYELETKRPLQYEEILNLLYKYNKSKLIRNDLV